MHDHPNDPSEAERLPRFFRGLLFLYFAICAVLCGGAIALAGCASTPQLPPGAVAFVTNSWQRAITQIEKTRERDAAAEDPATDSTTEHTDHTEGAQASSDSVPSVPSVVLDFRFGGFKGGGSVEDPATQIKGFKFSSSGMSYAWAKGDLGNWGLSHTDAGALACAFYWSDKEQKWIGGKFDWISTSRTSRSWENIRGHYNGWDPDAFFGAKRHAFCIVSRDGRKRTNLLEDQR